jgi:hypothetical protein
LKWEGQSIRGMTDVPLAAKCVSCPHTQKPWRFPWPVRLFQIKAESNNIGCQANLKRFNYAPSAACQGCADSFENTGHVLNCCQSRLNGYRERHDAAHDVLSAAMTKDNVPSLVETRTDRPPDSSISGSTLRPDQTNILKKRVAVGDVKCFYPFKDAMARVHAKNVLKYQEISTAYATHHGASSVVTIMLPTVGPVPKSTVTSLIEMGVSGCKVSKILSEMMIKVVMGNYNLRPKATTAGPAAMPDEFDDVEQANAQGEFTDAELDQLFEMLEQDVALAAPPVPNV